MFGVEADAAWADVGHSEAIVGLGTAKQRINSFGSVTGRVGVAVDAWLLYAKGGYAWANNEFSLTPRLGLARRSRNRTSTAAGPLAAARSGRSPVRGRPRPNTCSRATIRKILSAASHPAVGFGADVHTIKAGVNYRFGWASPVVAKY